MPNENPPSPVRAVSVLTGLRAAAGLGPGAGAGPRTDDIRARQKAKYDRCVSRESCGCALSQAPKNPRARMCLSSDREACRDPVLSVLIEFCLVLPL